MLCSFASSIHCGNSIPNFVASCRTHVWVYPRVVITAIRVSYPGSVFVDDEYSIFRRLSIKIETRDVQWLQRHYWNQCSLTITGCLKRAKWLIPKRLHPFQQRSIVQNLTTNKMPSCRLFSPPSTKNFDCCQLFLVKIHQLSSNSWLATKNNQHWKTKRQRPPFTSNVPKSAKRKYWLLLSFKGTTLSSSHDLLEASFPPNCCCGTF